MRPKITSTALAAFLLIWPLAAAAQTTGPDVAKARAAMLNASTPIEERVTRAMEVAADLDRLAQEARTIAERRERWGQAAGLLEDFAHANPDAEAAPVARFQAGVYLWAEGRSFADRVDVAPADAPARASAIDRFDRAIALFRRVGVTSRSKEGEPLAQNVRFRLAQALADRARLDRDADPHRAEAEREAVALLDRAVADPKFRGFARLLRGELNNRLGQFTQAQIDIEEAEKTGPPPDPESLARAKVAALIGRGQFAEARKVADGLKGDEAARAWLALRVLLGQRKLTAPGRDRSAIDAEAFGLVAGLRDSPRPEASRALMDLASVVDEPGEGRPLDWWDVLAEGHLRLGNPSRAGRVLGKGADRGEASGQDEAATTMRMKAGACLFEADKFAEAERQLARVGDDEAAPLDLRARAGMLLALARGRAVALKQPGATEAAYRTALEDQVRRFPDATTTGEARWLLGKVRLTEGRRDEAIALWSAVPRGQGRWLESRLEAADALRDAVADQKVNGDQKAIARKADQARDFLAVAEKEAGEGNEAVEIALRVALLELVPEVGRVEAALAACDRILKGAARPDQHEQARLVRLVALARNGQMVEAERDAREEARKVAPASLLPPVRLLDRLASETDAEQARRRLGKIDNILAARLAKEPEDLPAGIRDEARLRLARSFLFASDANAARREIAAWGGPTDTIDDALLRDLADTYFRLEAYPLAADAERLRGNRLKPGSPGWFESRYNLALAYFRLAKTKDARQVIDATAILHPELGGGELKEKFDRLRQRLAQE